MLLSLVFMICSLVGLCVSASLWGWHGVTCLFGGLVVGSAVALAPIDFLYRRGRMWLHGEKREAPSALRRQGTWAIALGSPLWRVARR